MEKQKCLEDRLADLSKRLEDSVSKKEVHVDIQMNFSPCYYNIIISLMKVKKPDGETKVLGGSIS